MAVIFSKTGYEGKYISTGNEYISLPRIDLNGSVNAAGFFTNEFDACLEYTGNQNMPLISPFLIINEKNYIEEFSQYSLESYWIPNFSKDISGLVINYKLITPITRKGFVCLLTVKNNNTKSIDFKAGFRGTWTNVLETCKTLRKLNFEKNIKHYSTEPNSFTFNIQGITNYYTMAMYWENGFSSDYCSLKTNETEKDNENLCYNIEKEFSLNPGESIDIPLFVGICKKETAAISVVKEMYHQGYRNLYSLLKKWLNKHIIEHKDPKIKQLINENSFYNFFYCQAITIDEEKLVITSARDSKSPYCGLYLDADSMRWSQLAVQLISWNQARKHLYYASRVQSEQMGQRSRTINGNILDMGIQLDAICSPIIALVNYIDQTGDKSILFSSVTQNNINYIQRLLSAQFDDKVYLLETLISPGGNYSSYPYICMQNILAWSTYMNLSVLYNLIRDIDKSKEMENIAKKIKEDIYKYSIKDTPEGKRFCYATDLDNHFIFGNSKTFSLRIMVNFGFIDKKDPIYINTLKYLDESEENKPINSTEILHDISNHLLIN
ncbi:MAG: glycoside hydrolase family 125 protein, partial [Armatimonadetes bacterium]|nr:glycoside hydrolase family 125 protein [Candidatus Hippobium faecium]